MINQLLNQTQEQVLMANNIKMVIDALKEDFPSIEICVKNNTCLPYVVTEINGDLTYMIDFERQIPKTLREYKLLAVESYNEAIMMGIYDCKKELKN